MALDRWTVVTVYCTLTTPNEFYTGTVLNARTAFSHVKVTMHYRLFKFALLMHYSMLYHRNLDSRLAQVGIHVKLFNNYLILLRKFVKRLLIDAVNIVLTALWLHS